MSAFIQPLECYKRDYDIVGNYKKGITKALSLATGDDTAKIYAWLDKKMENDWVPKSPEVRVLKRKTGGDRNKAKSDLLSYIKWVDKTESILAPNLVAYERPEREESFLKGFIIANLKNRSKVKKEGQLAEQRDDADFADFCNLLQANFKIRNNSISGALSSPHNPLYYASSHTSLTSVTRAITSYANACNEKFNTSNRHYFSPDVTMENIAYITSNADMASIAEAMDMYNLKPPTREYVMEQILKCTRLYWNDKEQERNIYELVCGMSPLERAAFSFIGDLNALQEVNDGPLRILYSKFLAAPIPVRDLEEQARITKGLSDDDKSLATLLGYEFMRGTALQDLDPENKAVWVGYVKQIKDILSEYDLFIKAFISAFIMPSSIHTLPGIIRRCVVGSDTDSSIYSTQRQVIWFTGKNDFSTESIKVGGITAFFSSQHIAHMLAMLSANMHVGEPELFRLNMKPEFYSMAQANLGNIAKHYFMDISSKEANFYKKPKMEAKGVNLKSSKLPRRIRSAIEDFMWYCLSLPANEIKVSPMEPIAIIATLEHRIKTHLLNGEMEFFKTEQVKTPETYASPTAAQIVCSNLWNDVFGSKYGRIEELPADCIKVNVALPKEKDIIAWGETLSPGQNRALKEFCESWDKRYFTQLLVPIELIENGRIQPEILSVIDLRKMLYSLVQPFYLMLNALSLNVANSKLTRFWSDEISEEQAVQWLPKGYKIEL